MKDLFPGYYRPTEEEFTELWSQATFVFDANVLLHIHRRNEQTRRTILDTLKKLGDRLWIPYEVAAEYQKNKLKVTHGLVNTCKPILDKLNEVKNALESSEVREHPFLDTNALSKELEKLITRVRRASDESRRVSVDDAESHELASLLQGRVGEPYADDELSKRREEAKTRNRNKVPPGYEDLRIKKDEDLAVGDGLIWFKLLDHAKTTHRPIIFITEDLKEDWWSISQGMTHGPRPELGQEMWKFAQQRFYIYKLSAFLEHAGRHLGQNVPEEVVKEVKRHEHKQKTVETKRSPLDEVVLSLSHHIIQERLRQLNETRETLAARGKAFKEIINNPTRPEAKEDATKQFDFIRAEWTNTYRNIQAKERELGEIELALSEQKSST